jgi:outer membrane receptor for ferrienterochelin and colicins
LQAFKLNNQKAYMRGKSMSQRFLSTTLVGAITCAAGASFAQTAPAPAEKPKVADTPATPNAPAATPARPPAKPDAKPEVKTESIEVSGRRTATSERRDSSASKIIISREDIEQYGDSNLGDVLRRLPGVTVGGGRPGRGGPPSMRGMGGGFTQILINGERISPGFSIEQITPEQVERIEILRAPTAETGARAIAGTINIVLREPLRARNNDIRLGVQDERGKFSPNVSWSRNDTFSPTGTYNMTLSAGQTNQLTDTATRTTYVDIPTNRLSLAQQTFSQAEEERDNIFLSSRFQWRLGPGELFSLQPFLVLNKVSNQTNGTLTQTVGIQPAPYATVRSDFDGTFNVARLMSMLNKRLNPSTRMELRASFGQFSSNNDLAIREFNANGARVLTQTTDSDTKDRSWNVVGKLLYNWGEGKHNLVGGWEFEDIKRTDNSTTLFNGVPLLADFGAQINVETKRIALYVQDEWDPTPQFSTYFGIRWEEINTKSRNLANPVNNKSSVVTPLAFGVYRFASPSRDQIRVSLTQSYRAPSTQNLVARPSLNTLFPVPGPNTSVSADRAGNANLKPELANGVDIAYEDFLEGGGVISVNLFTRQIKDLIRNVTALETVTWATSQRFVTRPQNLGRARTSGIEFDAKFRLPELIKDAPAINFRTNLSIFDSKVDSVKGPNNRISEQPRATGNFGIDYRFRGTPFSVGSSVNWTPAYDLQVANNQLQKINTRRVIDSYVLWTVNSGTRVRLSFSNMTPNDAINTNVLTQGSELQTVVTNGKTSMTTALRVEIRL